MSQFCRRHGCPNDAVPSQDYCDIHYLLPLADPHGAERTKKGSTKSPLTAERTKKGSTKSPLTAGSILQTAAQHMEDRAATYDQQGGERSIGKTVMMFNTLTGAGLTDEQGWLFMACLKMVRAQQGRYRADSYEDGAAYFALAGESAAQERVK